MDSKQFYAYINSDTDITEAYASGPIPENPVMLSRNEIIALSNDTGSFGRENYMQAWREIYRANPF